MKNKNVMSKIKEKTAEAKNFAKKHAGDGIIIGLTAGAMVWINLTYKKHCEQRNEDYNEWASRLHELYARKLAELTSKEELDHFVEADNEAAEYAKEEN